MYLLAQRQTLALQKLFSFSAIHRWILSEGVDKGGPIIIFDHKSLEIRYLSSVSLSSSVTVFTFCIVHLLSKYIYLLRIFNSLSSVSCQAVIKHGSRRHQAVVRQSSGSRQAVIRQLSGSHQAVIRQSSQFCFSFLKNVLNLQCLQSFGHLVLLLKSYARQGLCYYGIPEFQNMYHTWHPWILRF